MTWLTRTICALLGHRWPEPPPIRNSLVRVTYEGDDVVVAGWETCDCCGLKAWRSRTFRLAEP